MGIATADHVAKWNGTTWSALGSNGSGNGALTGPVYALAISGSDVLVGGDFANAAGVAEADYLARWSGSAWSAIGLNGAGNGALNSEVHAIAVSGTDLFAGGFFTNVAGIVEADRVARWNGSAWSALGSDGAGDGAIHVFVGALAVSGTDLYVGGSFRNAATIPEADYLAKWDGAAWSALGSNGAGNGAFRFGGVRAIALSGSDLYVGGYVAVKGNAKADYIAAGTAPRGPHGSNGAGDGAIDALSAIAVLDSDVFAGGSFLDAAGIEEADLIARFGEDPDATRQPDGRIRLGTSGPYVGNDLYNDTGVGQSRSGSSAPGTTITFQIVIQNDSVADNDRFDVSRSGAASDHFIIKYFDGAMDVTAGVIDGTYQTPLMSPGATRTITVTVKVKASAATGAKVVRLITIASHNSNPVRKDVVKFTAKRT